MGLFGGSKSSTQTGPVVRQSSTNASSDQGTSQRPAIKTTLNSGHSRPIFLLVWPNALFKAHWAIFVPEADDRTFKKGKYIHVEGNLKDGFRQEIVRGWDLNVTRRRPVPPIEIGWLMSHLVLDTPTDGRLTREAIPRDELEAILAGVPAPSQSLNSVSSAGTAGKKVELSDCQWWVTRCIHHLVENGYLIPPPKGLNKNKDPRTVLAEAPRH